MPAERLTMRKIREVFRLKFDCDISNRQIAKSCNIARSTVGEYLFRFQQAALSWPLPQDHRRQPTRAAVVSPAADFTSP